MSKLFLPIVAIALAVSCKDNYVPEPKPVQSDIEISAFYYPGTDLSSEWDMVEETLPQIKPLLGWYDEGNPEVIDWQIKWAVEHGISSFCLDWYWDNGAQRLDHWIKAYYKARWRNYLKWFIMWANHNAPGSHSTADQIAVTRFWVDNYFKTDEYYKIDGKPVVVTWNVQNLDRDFIREAAARGETLLPGEGVKRALAISDSVAVAAGLKGIYFMNMFQQHHLGNETLAKTVRDAGYRAQMVYSFDKMAYRFAPELMGPEDSPARFSFDLVTEAVKKWWDLTSKDSDIPFWPIIPSGWNDIPRSFQDAKIIYGRTPEKFAKMCRDAREFCDRTGNRHIIVAPINEWQEGSYLEPNEEFGFAFYDAIRDAFCKKPKGGWPKNIKPSDIGLGPYDFPAMSHPERTHWDFADGAQGWYRNPYGARSVKAENGNLVFGMSYTGHNKAAIRTRIAPFESSENPVFTIRMRLSANEQYGKTPDGSEKLTLWWGSDKSRIFDENFTVRNENSQSIPVQVDGQWHEYSMDLSNNPNWSGRRIDELWIDPVAMQYVSVDIDRMGFGKE